MNRGNVVRQADIHTKLQNKFPTLSQKNLLLMSEEVEILILKGSLFPRQCAIMLGRLMQA